MTPIQILFIVAAYFSLLIIISWFTSRKANNDTFFIGGHKSPWYLVAFGMIGTSLSGVTFISIPGWVASSEFAYMQTVLGYLVGYLVIGTVLMPLYYKMNLTSIYTYLEKRYGSYSYKTGALYFILSRIIGASFRLFLVASVLQFTVFDQLNIPFSVTVILTILLIWLYTFKGGIKTIVWTDTLQTFFMLTAVIVTIYMIRTQLDWSFVEMVDQIRASNYSKIFFFDDIQSPNYFWKHFLGGAFIAICMTGLDQDMMQKNLSCKNIGEAQKNMFWFSGSLVIVNLFFLSLGALLYLYTDQIGITLPEKSDHLYPMLAMNNEFGSLVAVVFILGLIAAAYSSADSALTALTTSFSIDILNIDKYPSNSQIKIRKLVHIGMSFCLFLCILLFRVINNESVIKELFVMAGYTYGPLLGLYSFGLLTKRVAKDRLVPIICIISPILCYFLKDNSETLFYGYKFGFELLVLNGVFTCIGLWSISKKP